jgi:hypothetical protein
VLAAFGLGADASGCRPLPGGHINDNYVLGSPPRFVVQRLNGRVFASPGAVVENGARISAHLATHHVVTPEPVATVDGQRAWRDGGGGWWRCWGYVPGTEGRLVVDSPAVAFETARAFGAYLAALDDLPAPPLRETIHRFHDLRWRLDQLEAAVVRDRLGRRVGAEALVERARLLGTAVLAAIGPLGAGDGRRAVHNDAKVSNVRFDADTGTAVCVVDLDTTMGGSALCDVGELVRTAGTYASEDAGDDDVDADAELCGAVAEGFLSAAGPVLSRDELDVMAWAGPWMAVENGSRFLADHLDGDRYYRVDRPDQNRDRAATQLRLCESMVASGPMLRAVFGGDARSA